MGEWGPTETRPARDPQGAGAYPGRTVSIISGRRKRRAHRRGAGGNFSGDAHPYPPWPRVGHRRVGPPTNPAARAASPRRSRAAPPPLDLNRAEAAPDPGGRLTLRWPARGGLRQHGACTRRRRFRPPPRPTPLRPAAGMVGRGRRPAAGQPLPMRLHALLDRGRPAGRWRCSNCHPPLRLGTDGLLVATTERKESCASGFRPGAGRPRGSRTVKPAAPAPIPGGEGGANLSPLDHLLAVMRDPIGDEARRNRAAIALLPYTMPKPRPLARRRSARPTRWTPRPRRFGSVGSPAIPRPPIIRGRRKLRVRPRASSTACRPKDWTPPRAWPFPPCHGCGRCLRGAPPPAQVPASRKHARGEVNFRPAGPLGVRRKIRNVRAGPKRVPIS